MKKEYITPKVDIHVVSVDCELVETSDPEFIGAKQFQMDSDMEWENETGWELNN